MHILSSIKTITNWMSSSLRRSSMPWMAVSMSLRSILLRMVLIHQTVVISELCPSSIPIPLARMSTHMFPSR